MASLSLLIEFVERKEKVAGFNLSYLSPALCLVKIIRNQLTKEGFDLSFTCVLL